MPLPESLLQIERHTGLGYLPVVDYATWRVAVLNYAPELEPEAIGAMQRHNDTDEVFVLLQGRCILFIGEGQEAVTAIHAQSLQPRTIYNVRQGVWHTHVLSRDAMVLVVENKDTTYDNSPFCELTTDQRTQLVALTRSYFSTTPNT